MTAASDAREHFEAAVWRAIRYHASKGSSFLPDIDAILAAHDAAVAEAVAGALGAERSAS